MCRGGWGEALTIVIVVANHHLLGLAVLAHLAPKVLVEGVEVVLQLARVHLVLGVVGRVLVEVGQEDGLRVRGLDVLAAAAVAVAAGADFVVEGAVDFVLLGAEDGGEVAVFEGGGLVSFSFSRLLDLGRMNGEGGESGAFTWPCFAVCAGRLGLFIVGFLVDKRRKS